jgi:F-type H+-transporting ATPase subunit gamma
VRRLQLNIAKLAREQAAADRPGQDGQDPHVGKKGYDSSSATSATRDRDRIELRGVKNVGFANAEEVGRKIMEMFEDGEFDVCTLFYATFKSVIARFRRPSS